jgi:hypothetical protein
VELSVIEGSKKIKMERTSESSSGTSTIHDEDDCYDWMPSSPMCPTQLDAESLDVLSNFSEEDINLFGDDTLLPETTRQAVPLPAGVCLHVFNKQMSLEFCVTCATRAQEKWSAQV